MNQEQVREAIEVMQAWLEGKTIQFRMNRPYEASWLDAPKLTWNFNEYEYRVKPVEPDQIDWDQIHPMWKYMARDENGRVYLFEDKPKFYATNWSVEFGEYARIEQLFTSYKQGDVAWQDSLVTRP